DVSFVDPNLKRALFVCGVGKVQAKVGEHTITAILDTGSEINVISRAACNKLGPALSPFGGAMRNADGRLSPMNHLCPNVDIEVEGVRTRTHLHVLDGPPYELLLGRPWQRTVRYQHRDIDEGLLVTIYDPDSSLPHSFIAAPSEQSDPRSAYRSSECDAAWEDSKGVCFDQPEAEEEERVFLWEWARESEAVVHATYKPVARKVRPVATNISEDDRFQIHIPPDFEDDLPKVPFSAPPFQPGQRLTQERLEELDLDPDGLLRPAELRLLVHILRENESALAFVDKDVHGAPRNFRLPGRSSEAIPGLFQAFRIPDKLLLC
ncbi:hypothetical protein CF326_g10043, partial [Tilletia indica]